MSIGRGGAMEAKCLAIAHAELGGIAVHREPHTVGRISSRTVREPHDDVKYDEQPPGAPIARTWPAKSEEDRAGRVQRCYVCRL